ncbi:MAG: glycosyltransferase family 2 protein [Deltaproteobacteria bacterium]|nr:MAG: glycosyltransferase family 2 protein [Deltaproteobacteria bacterium]
MYRGLSVIAVVPVLNEETKIGRVVRRTPRTVVDELLVVDDGSTDRSPEIARQLGATVLPMGRVAGVGAALRAGYHHAVEHGYDVSVVMAGNDKDAPEEIPLLLDPIAEDRADFVQGSRFLKPGANFGAMPLYRRVATRVHPVLFSLAARRWVTESTNGFRALHRRVLTDPRLDLSPAWLDAYELEPFLYLQAIRLGYRTAEVPVTKVYPPRHLGQTKMKPLIGWWSILRPLVYAGLRFRR